MKKWACVRILFILLSPCCRAGTPAPARFFPDQFVDHIGPNNSSTAGHDADDSSLFWTQRYYVWEDYFQGPGFPIFLVLGGEGAIEPETGLFYPFVTHHLAKSLGAYVLQPEHRFYGSSQPVSSYDIAQARAVGLEDPRVRLLTSEQALHDAIRLLRKIKHDLGCSGDDDRGGVNDCPVISVGGSYPGYLSAMARLVFPDDVDMAYAASAPMHFYSQSVLPEEYYNHITDVAELAYPGCAAAVKLALADVQSYFRTKDAYVRDAWQVGICKGTIPKYIQDTETFLEEVFMMVGYTFANDNMAYYPPSNDTRLVKSCRAFSRSDWTCIDKLRFFLVDSLAAVNNDCVDMRMQLPSGPHATISSGDWSGVGSGG
jgi:hypothetical protein